MALLSFGPGVDHLSGSGRRHRSWLVVGSAAAVALCNNAMPVLGDGCVHGDVSQGQKDTQGDSEATCDVPYRTTPHASRCVSFYIARRGSAPAVCRTPNALMCSHALQVTTFYPTLIVAPLYPRPGPGGDGR